MAKQYVSGFREAELVLRDLPPALEARVLQSATLAGVRKMRKAVKANAPRSTGKRSKASVQYGPLFGNIKVQSLKSVKRKGRRGARVFTGDGFWGQFLEFGTRFIAARPWFRPAVESSKDSALKALREGLAKGLDREATKLAKKNRVK